MQQRPVSVRRTLSGREPDVLPLSYIHRGGTLESSESGPLPTAVLGPAEEEGT